MVINLGVAVIQFISQCHYTILYLHISSLENMNENIQISVQGTYYDLILCLCHSITPVIPKLRYPKLEQESVNTLCFTKYYEGGLKKVHKSYISDTELVEISYAVSVCVYI
jgi:hypothetical protein